MLSIYLILQSMDLFHLMKFSMDLMQLAYILQKRSVFYLLVAMIKPAIVAYRLMSLWMHF